MSRCIDCYYFDEEIYIDGDKHVDYCHWNKKQIHYLQQDKECKDFEHEQVVHDAMLEEWEK